MRRGGGGGDGVWPGVADASGSRRAARWTMCNRDRVVVQTAHLARLVNLNKPGEYKVRVSRRDPESQAVVESNEITLNVVP